jgi:hypothetical protein
MRTFVIVAASLLLSSPVLAQNTTGTQPQQTPSAQASQDQNSTSQTSPAQDEHLGGKIAQKIRSNLEKAGFKNIKLMPSSFMVRADDQDGNPVMMVINPDSITEVTGSNSSSTSGNNQNNTVGQNSGSANSSNGGPSKMSH